MGNAIRAGILQLGSALVAGLFYVVVARNGGEVTVGATVIAVSVALVMADLVDFGQSNHLLRRMAAEREAVEWRSHLAQLLGFKVSALPLVTIVMIGALGLLMQEGALVAIVAAVDWLLLSFTQSLGMLLRLRERFTALVLCTLAGRVVSLSLAAVLRPAEAVAYVGLVVLGDLVALGLIVRLSSEELRLERPRHWRQRIWESRQFGIASLSTDIHNLDTPVVTAVVGQVAGGLYAIGNRVAAPIGTVGGQLSQLAFVRVASLGWRGARSLVLRISALVLAVGVVGIATFAVVGERLLGLVFGGPFEDAYVPTLFMIAVSVWGLLNGIASACLMAGGRSTFVARLSLGYAGVTLVLLAVGGALSGVNGAAGSLLVGQAIFSCSVVIYVWRVRVGPT